VSGTCALDPIFFSTDNLGPGVSVDYFIPGSSNFYHVTAIAAGAPALGALPVAPEWKAELHVLASGRIAPLMLGPHNPGSAPANPDFSQKPWFNGAIGTQIALRITNISAVSFDVVVEAVVLDN
jgi:hypothetical protein